MLKSLAVAAALSMVFLPRLAAASDPAPREPQTADLEPWRDEGSARSGSEDQELQLVLSLGSASERRTSAPAGVNVGLLYLRAIAGSVGFIGSGVGYYRSISQMSGSATVGGGSAELLLTPRLVSVPLALRLGLGPRLYAAVEPALVVGWVEASVRRSSGAALDTSSSPGVGFQLAAGFEAQLTARFGLTLQAGYRAVKPSLSVRAMARPGEPLGGGSQSVDVDLSGVFWNAGLVVRL